MADAFQFQAKIEGWVAGVERKTETVLKNATIRTIRLMTTPQPSVKVTGGSYEIGKIPYDTWELIDSQVLVVNGQLRASGRNSVERMGSLDWGDRIDFHFTAEYARAIEYGLPGLFGGRFYRRTAIQKWPETVEQEANKVRSS